MEFGLKRAWRWGAVGLMAVAMAACTPVPDEEAVEGAAGQEIAIRTIPRDIAANPDAYIGKTVMVRGEIQNVISPQAVTMEPDSIIGDELLVIFPRQVRVPEGRTAAAPFVRDDLIQVMGTVRMMRQAETEDWWNLIPDGDRVEYENEPVIIAQYGQFVPKGDFSGEFFVGYEDTAVGDDMATDTTTTTRPVTNPETATVTIVPVPVRTGDRAATGDRQATITDVRSYLAIVHENPDQIVGRKIDIDDVKVQGVPGRNTFWIGPNPANEVLVIMRGSGTTQNIEPGSTVSVTGTVGLITEQIRNQYDLSNLAPDVAVGDHAIFMDSVQTQ